MAKTNPTPPVLTAKDARRFWSHVAAAALTDCWPWNAARLPKGYGLFGARPAPKSRHKNVLAHRVAFFLITDSWPPVVMHGVCDNPPCCNPLHLAGGTIAENNEDAAKKGRTAKGDRHNSRTHPERIQRGTGHWTHRQREKWLNARNQRTDFVHGEQHGRAKLTLAQVRCIRHLLRLRVPMVAVARWFGVRYSSVYGIKHGITWSRD